MKIIPSRTIYRCDYCTAHRLSAAAARNHEMWCKRNPVNQHACFGCQHLQATEEVVNGGKAKRFTCTALSKALFSYKALKRGIQRESLGGSIPDAAERMPLQCPARCAQLVSEPDNIPF